jgi:hypothetical protein
MIIKACLIFLFSLSTHANEATNIMLKVDKRDTGKDFVAIYKMDIKNKSKVKSRELLWWRLNESPKTFNMIKIKTPKQLKNTGLLIFSDKKGEDKSWLFLSKAAKKEPRAISTGNKDSRFLGSEFYYIDFEETGVNEFTHSLKGKIKIKDWNCTIIESIPKDKDYVYSKVISYVDMKTLVVVKSELFKSKQMEKTFSVLRMSKKNNIWTIEQSLMKNMQKKKETLMTLIKIKYNNALKKSFFSNQSLTREI